MSPRAHLWDPPGARLPSPELLAAGLVSVGRSERLSPHRGSWTEEGELGGRSEGSVPSRYCGENPRL